MSEEAIGTGNILGIVQTINDEPLPGVVVTLSSEGHEPREEVTNAEGKFRFMDVMVGSYSLKATMPGFHPVDCPQIIVHEGENEIVLTMAVNEVEA
ncbi:MAG: carboxypeptidase regulatory-like domain-containing protein [Ignavibacteriae bacterium]|nr:carboxypeptidase regulatory-like domain-containing protein [Ignavibacteriota bacterium]